MTARILLVDDDANIRDTAKDILEDAHYAIVTASDGAEAMREIAQSPFQLLIVDFNLPDGSGMDLAKKARLALPLAKIILLTGDSTLDRSQIDSSTVYDYLVKPVDPTHLLAVIAKALR